jgi:hypothetical protein
MRRTCRRRAERTLSDRTVPTPAADILGQDLLQIAPIAYEQVVQALGTDRSRPALGDCIGPRRSERRASLGDTEITHPTIEAGAIAAVAVMNEKTWRLAVPTAAFDNLLCRPFSGRMLCDPYVENLPPGMMGHEDHVQRSKRDGLDTKKSARPDGRCVPPQE